MTRSAAPLLVTGFGPFPGMPDNPSGRLARLVGASVRLRLALGGHPRVLVLRTAYAAIEAELEPALAQDPRAVLMLGVASRAKRIRVEVRARNRASALHPDASGRASATVLDPGAPRERRSPSSAAALALLRRAGLDARLSNDAGAYLCNASYFRALAQDRPVLFVHVPPARRTKRPRATAPNGVAPRPTRRGDEAAQVAGLVEVARLLARRGSPASGGTAGGAPAAGPGRGARAGPPRPRRIGPARGKSSPRGAQTASRAFLERWVPRHPAGEAGAARQLQEWMMVDTDRIAGAAREIGGKAQGAAGDFVGSNRDSVEGRFREAQGGAQNAYGQAKDAVRDAASKAQDYAGDVVDRASARADDVYNRASDAYDRAAPYVRDQHRAVASRVEENPMIALLIAGAVGYGLALLLHGRR